MTGPRWSRSADLSATAPPPPCSVDPDRWFDRAHRSDALAICLQCPLRRECAQHALRVRARWGMWAGIWIDGRLEDRAHLLRTIAAEECRLAYGDADTSSTAAMDPVRPPLPPTSPVRTSSVSTIVLARSSGHCEVVDDGCRITADMHTSRLPQGSTVARSASTMFSVCLACARLICSAGYSTRARESGYLVDSPGSASEVPFLWRGARWVRLGRDGLLREVAFVTGSNRASWRVRPPTAT